MVADLAVHWAATLVEPLSAQLVAGLVGMSDTSLAEPRAEKTGDEMVDRWAERSAYWMVDMLVWNLEGKLVERRGSYLGFVSDNCLVDWLVLLRVVI